MLSLNGFKFISKENVKGKTIVLRTDLNSTIVSGNVVLGPKFAQHGEEIKNLAEKGARIIVISHQGRKGRDDFVSLKSHKKLLEEICGKEIEFSDWKEDFSKKIKSLKNGEVLLFENSRFLPYESEEAAPSKHAEHEEIKKIAELSDYFILDALSIAHRAHATVVGFTPLLPSFVGQTLEIELKALKELKPDHNVLLLGGMKPEDSIKVMRQALQEDRARKILLGGILGELALKASGYSLGSKDSFIDENGFLPLVQDLEEIIANYKERIVIPADVAIDANGERKNIKLDDLPVNFNIFDIGEKTMQEFCKHIHNAEVVVFNGPLGKFEDERFCKGTKEVIDCVVNSKAFSLIGGGDTLTCVKELGFNKQQFSHASLAGKALLRFLAGKRLRGLQALHRY